MEERIIKDVNNLLTQLFQKMKESGYEWDAEKKELKKIEQKPTEEWSEEDENTRKKIIKFLKEQNYFDGKVNEFKEPYKKEYEWLKSLKPKSRWKPSDEQITWLYRAADDASKDSRMKQVLNELLSDLKKLREE